MLRKSVLLGIGIVSIVGILSIANAHGGFGNSRGWSGGYGMMGGGHMWGGDNNSRYDCPYENSSSRRYGVGNKKEAMRLAEQKLYTDNNNNLKIANVEEKDDRFLVTIVTKKEEAVVETYNIDKETGRFYRN